MAVVLVASRFQTNADGTSVLIDFDAGTVVPALEAGDLLLAATVSNDQTMTAPSGWTLLDTRASGTQRGTICYKLATASEPRTFTFSVPTATQVIAIITVWRGVDQANPIHTHAYTVTTTEDPVTGPSVTTTTSCRLLHLRQVRSSGVGDFVRMSTTDATVTELRDNGTWSGTIAYEQAIYDPGADVGPGTSAGIPIAAERAVTNGISRTLALAAATPPTRPISFLNRPALPANPVVAGEFATKSYTDTAMALASSAPASVGAANTVGTGSARARADHVHAERQATLDRITDLEQADQIVVVLTDAATVATDASLGSFFRLSMAGNRTLGAPANPTDGQTCTWEVTASGAARTLTLATGAGGFVLSTSIAGITATSSGLTDYIRAVYSASADRWRVLDYAKGFA